MQGQTSRVFPAASLVQVPVKGDGYETLLTISQSVSLWTVQLPLLTQFADTGRKARVEIAMLLMTSRLPVSRFLKNNVLAANLGYSAASAASMSTAANPFLDSYRTFSTTKMSSRSSDWTLPETSMSKIPLPSKCWTVNTFKPYIFQATMVS